MPIYSLGPPRMTRKVLTPEEFHEQMRLEAESANISLEDRVIPGSPGSEDSPASSHKSKPGQKVSRVRKRSSNGARSGINPSNSLQQKYLNGLHLGHYKVRDMRKTSTGIEFLDLALPMGVFPSVTLMDPPHISRVPSAAVKSKKYLGDLSQWQEYNSKHAQSSAHLMMPLWFYYGLMKSAMGLAGLTKSPSAVGATERVPQIFQKVHHNYIGWYTATTASYDNLRSPSVNHGLGLPASDLTGCFGVFFPQFSEEIGQGASTPTTSVIASLFLENSLWDLCSVFSWGLGDDHVFISGFPSQPGNNRPVHLRFKSKSPSSTTITYDQDPANTCYAIGVHVDLKSFKPY